MPTLDWKHYGVLAAYALLTFFVNLVFSKRSQIDAWCEANPRLAAFAKLFRGAGVDPWAIAQAVVLFVTKQLPGYQKQTLPQLAARSRRRGFPPAMMLALCLIPLIAGCAWLKGSFWPAVAHCAPSAPDAEKEAIADILLAGGDVEAGLEAAALKYTKDVVLCLVTELEQTWSQPGGKARESATYAAAAARARAFLATSGAKVEQ